LERKPKTYPHSYITEKCAKEYLSWEFMECVLNSLIVYYNPKMKKSMERDGEKFVEVPKI